MIFYLIGKNMKVPQLFINCLATNTFPLLPAQASDFSVASSSTVRETKKSSSRATLIIICKFALNTLNPNCKFALNHLESKLSTS